MNKTCVNVNRHAIVDLVLYGPEHRVESLFRFLASTMKRLGKKFEGRGFRQAPKGEGGWPNDHDTARWLDSLSDDECHEDDVVFLVKLSITCRGRVRPALVKELKV